MTESPPTAPGEAIAQTVYLLGQIHGIVEGLREGQQAQAARLSEMDRRQEDRLQRIEDTHRAELARVEGRVDAQDARIRNVEQRAAVMGALSGSAVSVGVALMVEGLREWLKR